MELRSSDNNTAGIDRIVSSAGGKVWFRLSITTNVPLIPHRIPKRHASNATRPRPRGVANCGEDLQSSKSNLDWMIPSHILRNRKRSIRLSSVIMFSLFCAFQKIKNRDCSWLFWSGLLLCHCTQRTFEFDLKQNFRSLAIILRARADTILMTVGSNKQTYPSKPKLRDVLTVRTVVHTSTVDTTKQSPLSLVPSFLCILDHK